MFTHTHTHTPHAQGEDWEKSERLGGLLGRFHHRRRPPSAVGGGGDRLFFTVRDLIAHRFHYLCTNVTFSSDQGARQPLAARLASCQAIVQPIEEGVQRVGWGGGLRGEEGHRDEAAADDAASWWRPSSVSSQTSH